MAIPAGLFECYVFWSLCVVQIFCLLDRRQKNHHLETLHLVPFDLSHVSHEQSIEVMHGSSTARMVEFVVNESVLSW